MDKGNGLTALEILNFLCGVKPNRRTGSKGNNQAADFFIDGVKTYGFDIDAEPFSCLDFEEGEVSLAFGGENFNVFISPYSLPCAISAELKEACSIDELAALDGLKGKILLMRGELCSETLMPKNFVFYNPDHHKKIYSLLEEKCPAAIITASEKSAVSSSALYPFPVINDGDFNIPVVYASSAEGEKIARNKGKVFNLKIVSKRIKSSARNIILFKNPNAPKKIVVTAHIDSYENSPGALDNASGIAVLMLLARLLKDYNGPFGVEIAALNGEDHYSAGGQMDYIKKYGGVFNKTVLAVNIDGAGYKEGKTEYSFYSAAEGIKQKSEKIFSSYGDIQKGPEWYCGDHMIFVQNGVPALAFTSENIEKLTASVTHTPKDSPDIINSAKLVSIAEALKKLIDEL